MHQITINGIRWGYLDVTEVVALRPVDAVLEIILRNGERLVCNTGSLEAHDLADMIYNRMQGEGVHIALQSDTREERV